MNTSNIKSFAQKARLLLMDGVAARLIYWGFDEIGNTSHNLQETTGGYTFRGEVFTDTAVPEKWKKLKAKLKDSQAVKDVIEEAAYTWFNRLMAIKILEKNGYLPSQLKYVDKLKVPEILQRAKRGDHQLNDQLYKELLPEYLQEDKEEDALGLLLTRFSNNHPLLHDVFGRIDDYTEILLPQNLLQPDGILDLINSDFIEEEDYSQVELIGWLYQFYISDKKDEVFKGFKKNKKARAEDIPAATQIFTPKWIVKYMVENTLGKTYLDLEPDSSLKKDMEYLVENESESPVDPIIGDVEELSLLDPASGSGHILVTGFELLFKMYREAGYNAKQATLSILENNLFGLDIDERAMQLARFAVLLKAAKEYPEILEPINGKIQLPHIYAFPEAADFSNEELQSFLGEEREHLADLKDALHFLKQGKNIGAALKFNLSEATRNAIASQYNDWIKREANLNFNEQLIWNKLKPFIEVLLVMNRQYIAVVANPPYMGQKSMNAQLKSYINSNYPRSKSDLFAVFMEVCLNLTSKKAYMGMINQHSWMFLSSYGKLRDHIIDNFSIKNMLHLGPRTFEELSGEVVQSTAFVLQSKVPNKDDKAEYYRLVDYRNNEAKEANFLKGNNRHSDIPQINFEKIPGSPIAYWVSERVIENFKEKKLITYAHSFQGIITGNNAKLLRLWSEIDYQKIKTDFTKLEDAKDFKAWIPYQKGGGFRRWYGLNELMLKWNGNGSDLTRSRSENRDYYFKNGLTWSFLTGGTFAVRETGIGNLWDVAGSTFFPHKEENFAFLLALYNTKVIQKFLNILNPTINYQVENILLCPVITEVFDENKVPDLANLNKKISKLDWDSRETSWDFEQNPLLTINEDYLKEAYTEWQENAKEDFFQLHRNEEELNRIFIDIYGLQEELTPEVPLKNITILQEELNRKALEKLEAKFRKKGKEAIDLPIQEDEVMSQFISYLIGIMMGRYRLDKPGLKIAHPNPTEEETTTYTYNGQKIEIDKDAILPLMGEDCAFPDDILVQLKKLLHTIWGEDSLTANINFLQQCLGTNLHSWLTSKFWKYHTGMYKKKPIYWLFSSNPKKPENSAFKVLAYMHRMDKFTVQQIQRNYLYPHQDHIKSKLQNLRDNEANLNRDEQKELEKLQSWDLELRDYNEVLKELANQQIEFDLDEGVTENYKKFEGAVAKI